MKIGTTVKSKWMSNESEEIATKIAIKYKFALSLPILSPS